MREEQDHGVDSLVHRGKVVVSDPLSVMPTTLDGVKVIEPRTFQDERGGLFEFWSAARYASAGISTPFVQGNHSINRAGAVRGLHFCIGTGQAKLIWVTRGSVLDVVVDVRVGSPTFGGHLRVELSAKNRRQLYVPAGFAHGFVALEDADVQYLLSDRYRPEFERGISWRDPCFGLPWPLAGGIQSPRDRALPLLADFPVEELPRFEHAS